MSRIRRIHVLRTLLAFVFVLLVTVGPTVAGDAGSEMATFQSEYVFGTPIDGCAELPVTIELTEVGDGNSVDIHLSIPDGEGDLLGLFGNVADESLVPQMGVVDPSDIVTSAKFKANGVDKVGPGNNVLPAQGWDFGLQLGKQGGQEIVESASFRLVAPGLDVESLLNASNETWMHNGWILGVRIQSTRQCGGSAKIGLYADAPRIWIATPQDGALVNESPLTVTGGVTGKLPLTVEVNGIDAAVSGETFSASVPLFEGANTLTARATNEFATASTSTSVTLDSIPPTVTITAPDDGASTEEEAILVTGTVEDAHPDPNVLINGQATPLTNGQFTATVPLELGNNTIEVVAEDLAGNTGAASIQVTREDPSGGLPPDPADVAPELDRTVATTMAVATEFLYTGDNPIQTGVEAGTIEARRVAVIRGRVLTRDEEPLPGVTITILDHPEFGQTLSRADGMFDLAVNGGGWLTINYEKEGYLPAQRQLQTPWQDYVWVDDVVLIQLDSHVTEVDLSTPVPMQVAEGSVVTDDDGTRQAVLMIPQGTTAELVMPDGSVQPITTLHVRATEYSVGDTGQQAMPAELPCQSGYTYAVELSADEAIAAGASDVQFSQPLFSYVDNFLDFPVGGIVPSGYYDRERGAWIPSPNGRVIAIVSINGGLAEVDTDGDGLADDGADLGMTDAERQELAARYAPGRSVWRIPVEHFTPWDWNWPYGPDEDAEEPNQEEPWLALLKERLCNQSGSIIECESQTLREEVPVAGTPFTLHYGSDRVAGRANDRTVEIPLSDSSVPASLKRIELTVSIAGREFHQTFPAQPDQTATFTWDGLDAYGRPVQGRQDISTRIDYVYDAVYMEPAQLEQAFALYSGVPLSGSRARQEVYLGQEWHEVFGTWEAKAVGLGGWSLDQHQSYDGVNRVLYLGDGEQRRSDALGLIIDTVAGTGQPGFSGDGGPATAADLGYPRGLDVGPDGALYFVDSPRIRRVGPDGIITTVAGSGQDGYGGDGGPATQASFDDPNSVAVGPEGSLYIADYEGNRIRRVGPDGIITTVAGTGQYGYGGDGSLATEVNLSYPADIDVGPDGVLYIILEDGLALRVGPDGIITTVAGNSDRLGSYSGDGGPATQAGLNNPYSIALGPCNCFYIADGGNRRVRRVGPDGIITTFAGNGGWVDGGPSGDGGPAELANIMPLYIDVGEDGSLYVLDWGVNNRIRVIGPDSIITTVAGSGEKYYAHGDGGPATQASFYDAWSVAVGPDGSVYIADGPDHRIRRVRPPSAWKYGHELFVPSQDGQQLYIFDTAGRHLRTIHSLTGATLFEFDYDGSGLLVAVIDGDGNVTTIERDAGGQPTAIVAPFGQRTELGLDANGYLDAITNPAGETTGFTYTNDGLMASMSYPNGGASAFEYDAFGRLIRDVDARGGAKTLLRSENNSGYSVALTSAEGWQTVYSVEFNSLNETIRQITYPDGSEAEMTIGTDGSTLLVLPDGTEVSVLEGPDPRFGMLAALPQSQTMTTPDGRIQTTTMERTVDLADPDDILSLTSLTDVITVNGRAYTSAYDAASRTFTDTSPEGRGRTRTLDSQGRIVLEQMAGLAPVVYNYDANGRLAAITQGTGGSARSTQFSYDSAGYLATIVDPLGRTVAFDYDAAGRITQQTLPDGRVIGYGYDAHGNTTSLTPPGRPAHNFAYDAVDLETVYNPPDVGLSPDETLTTYDLDRQVTRIVLPTGQNLEFIYDATTGNLSSLTFSSGTSSFGYDASSGLTASIAAPGGIGLAFDYDGSLLTEESWSGPVAGDVGRTFDDNFRTAALSVNGASAVAYQYDDDGMLTQAGALAVNRNAQHGLVTGTTLGTVTDAWGYSGFGELSTYAATAGGSAVYDVQYTRDGLGRITRLTETIGGATDVYDYRYDTAGRLEEVDKNSALLASYGYDSNGNRLGYTGPSGAVAGTYDDQDRLLTYGAATYAYTVDGRLQSRTIAGQTTTYEYDELANLLSVSLPGGPQIEYLIDGRDRRVGKLINGTLVQGWLYQDDLNPVAELDGAGNVVSRFVYGTRSNVPDYMISGGVTYRLISDHLGSPRLVIDTSTGVVAQRMDYDVFGRVLLDTNPGFQPFGFAGGLYDADTGLVRFGARDYDAETGRWLTKDAFWNLNSGVNLYTYAGNDPANMIDPEGRDGVPSEYVYVGSDVIENFMLVSSSVPQQYWNAEGQLVSIRSETVIENNMLVSDKIWTNVYVEMTEAEKRQLWIAWLCGGPNAPRIVSY